ncbi:MAG TPA: hypothetical protein VFK94_06725 [Patescibacteria group bacterium]|nr:hypothetical protein [Patescibacteria group bacterium]
MRRTSVLRRSHEPVAASADIDGFISTSGLSEQGSSAECSGRTGGLSNGRFDLPGRMGIANESNQVT